MIHQAPVNRIIPISVVDGPGSRSAVFLQGCNISCAYCHNPETQKLCNSCGECLEVCPSGALSLEQKRVVWDETCCISCDACIKACRQFASPKVKRMSALEVFDCVGQNRPFIRGITVSGGECSLYPDFLTDLFTLAKKEGLNCLMDSNGMVDLSKYPGLLDVCDGVMLDVKGWDKDLHQRLTGADNEVVLKNLKLLHRIGRLFEVRIVCQPEAVDAEDVIRGIAGFLDGRLDFCLKLISFRDYGVRGWMKGKESPSMEVMEGLAALAKECGFLDVVMV